VWIWIDQQTQQTHEHKKKLKILRKIPWSIKIHTNPLASDMSKPFGFQQPLEVPNLFNISLDQIPIIMK
jgi:hypothetical protein